MSRRQPTRQNAGLFKGEQLSAWARAAEGYREAVSRGSSRRVIAKRCCDDIGPGTRVVAWSGRVG